MSVVGRNVELDARSLADPNLWPFEAVLSAIERGSLREWRLLAAAINSAPWGPCADAVSTITGWHENPGVDEVFQQIVANARLSADTATRRRFGHWIRSVRERLGLTQREFAELIGTSASRLSTYETGKVAPSIEILGRAELLTASRGLEHRPFVVSDDVSEGPD